MVKKKRSSPDFYGHFVVSWDNYLKHSTHSLALEEQRIECCLSELNRVMDLAGECIGLLIPRGMFTVFPRHNLCFVFLLTCQYLLK